MQDNKMSDILRLQNTGKACMNGGLTPFSKMYIFENLYF